MKTNPMQSEENRLGRIFPRINRSIVLWLLAAHLGPQIGFAEHSPTRKSPPPLDEAARAKLGRISVVPGTKTVELRFDRSDGSRFDSEDAALEGANGPKELGNKVAEFGEKIAGAFELPFVPAAAAIASPFVVAGIAIQELAPVGALVGMKGASRNRISPDQLAELERDLIEAMKTVAVHARLRDDFLKAARERTGRGLDVRDGVKPAPNDPTTYESFAKAGIQTLLEISLEKVELRRVAKSDDSFALVVIAQVRLFQTQDGSVICNLLFEYQSGSGLFLDWTLKHAEAFQRVFETASRHLAGEMVRVLFLEPRPSNPKVAARRPAESVNHHTASKLSSASLTRVVRKTSPQITFVERPSLPLESLVNLGTVGIISTSTVPKISIHRPLSKQQAAREACEDASQILGDYGSPLAILVDGPMNFARGRRPIQTDGGPGGTVLGPITEAAVRAGAMAVATPIGIGVGLGGQVDAVARGLSDKKLKATDTAVTKAAVEANPQESLRTEVLRQAQQLTSHPVALIKKPFPPGEEEAFSQMACVMSGTLAWVPDGQTPATYLMSQGIDTALEIQLLYPALNSEGRINPSMTFNVEVRARLFRVKEGHELYSFAMKYRGREQKFAAWAAHNAQPLRDELENFSQVVAATIIDQLLLPAWPREMPVELAGEKIDLSK